MSEFIAACGHKTDTRNLGRICEECFTNTHAELATLRAQLAEAERQRDEAIAACDAEHPEASLLRAQLSVAVKAIAERMPHDPKCYSQTHCGVGACRAPPWAERHMMTKMLYLHEFEPGTCNCPVGELLAKVGEVLK